MAFKVEVQVFNDPWTSNALVFGTKEEAAEYGQDLYSRWTAVREWRVTEVEDAVNYTFVDGKLTRLEGRDEA